MSCSWRCGPSHIYTLQDEKFEGIILRATIRTIEQAVIVQAVQESLYWLDKNQLAVKDVFAAKQKELECVVNPIMLLGIQIGYGVSGIISIVVWAWLRS